MNSIFLTKWPPTWTDKLEDILIWFQRLWNQAKIASWPKNLANSRTNWEALNFGSKWSEIAGTRRFFRTWDVLNLVTPWSMIFMHLHVCLCNQIISQKYEKEEGEFWGTTPRHEKRRKWSNLVLSTIEDSRLRRTMLFLFYQRGAFQSKPEAIDFNQKREDSNFKISKQLLAVCNSFKR